MTFEESEKLFFTSLLKINKYFLGKALILWWFTIAGGRFSQTNDFSLNEAQWSYFINGSIEIKEQTNKMLLPKKMYLATLKKTNFVGKK